MRQPGRRREKGAERDLALRIAAAIAAQQDQQEGGEGRKLKADRKSFEIKPNRRRAGELDVAEAKAVSPREEPKRRAQDPKKREGESPIPDGLSKSKGRARRSARRARERALGETKTGDSRAGAVGNEIMLYVDARDDENEKPPERGEGRFGPRQKRQCRAGPRNDGHGAGAGAAPFPR